MTTVNSRLILILRTSLQRLQSFSHRFAMNLLELLVVMNLCCVSLEHGDGPSTPFCDAKQIAELDSGGWRV